MGWTYTTRHYGQTVQQFFERSFNHDDGKGRSGKVLRCSATYNVAYMAYEVKYPDKDGTVENDGTIVPFSPAKTEVIALVCLIQHVPKAKDGYNFGYKDMEESMGPCERRCPKTILEMLTPTTSEYAIEWRKDCWERINKKKNNPKVHPGDWLEFAKATHFKDGSELTKLQWLRGNRFKRYYTTYILPRWREQEYKNLGQLRETPE